jgi:predicted NodU family carbamoyl transferase
MVYMEECCALLKDNLHLRHRQLVGQRQTKILLLVLMLAEELIYSVMRRAKEFNWSSNLVYMGGVALNCLANRNLGEYFENIWIMPCPGDAGSSLGAAALAYKNVYTGAMRTLAIKSQENILSAPSLIVYSVIESAVSLVVEPNLDPEPLEIEVSSPTQEE